MVGLMLFVLGCVLIVSGHFALGLAIACFPAAVTLVLAAVNK